MKKYIKNKDFIPEKFYDAKEASRKNSVKRMACLFLIMNLILLPITAERFIKNQDKSVINANNMNNVNYNTIDIDDLNILIESVMRDNIDEVSVTKNSGELLVSNFDKINELSKNDLIKINKVELNSNDKYKLEVSLNE